ncbi:hypothetical protein BV22DRAFT_1052573 [Leucogyrophana mollusca]|uniref:Uncharacterized protein n=1 Tax=Leucogyrophana mollusca TaxID=85980 RepID=A0ACB8AVF6_9AGAM|nr:hypothetical protein BV22DRAFT_1052573 [Leucogyrophana mollusca]
MQPLIDSAAPPKQTAAQRKVLNPHIRRYTADPWRLRCAPPLYVRALHRLFSRPALPVWTPAPGVEGQGVVFCPDRETGGTYGDYQGSLGKSANTKEPRANAALYSLWSKEYFIEQSRSSHCHSIDRLSVLRIINKPAPAATTYGWRISSHCLRSQGGTFSVLLLSIDNYIICQSLKTISYNIRNGRVVVVQKASTLHRIYLVVFKARHQSRYISREVDWLTRPGVAPPTQRQASIKRGEPCEMVQTELYKWRKSVTKRDFPGAFHAAPAVLKDKTLELVSAVGPIRSKAQLGKVLGQWKWYAMYGDELFQLLKGLDIPALKPLPKKP